MERKEEMTRKYTDYVKAEKYWAWNYNFLKMNTKSQQ